MILYNLLLFIHIFSAILGVGPGFILITLVTKATTMTELRHAYHIRSQIHVFVIVGGALVLISGLGMGLLNPHLFLQGWYVLSLLLFIVALALGPTVLAKKIAPIKLLLQTHKGEEIPGTYARLAKSLFFYERIELGVLSIIIVLMILKPF